VRDTHLTPELEACRQEIITYAQEYGLDFYETIFELLDYQQINMVASYGGFPSRYPHWRFGMEYEQLSKGYAYGLQKIYEMVINNDPCYAYLLRANNIVDQKMVMAHVYGHCDFFKNNYWFSRTHRKMMNEMANHGSRIRRYMDRVGVDEVEKFIDICLSLDNLIDVHLPFIKREREDGEGAESERKPVRKLKSKDYMDDFINPDEFLKEQADRQKKREEKRERLPDYPMKDVMLFLLRHAPLKPWQQDILSMIREEAYYFAPQAQTKIMNEGWASYWHSRIMTTRALRDSEVIDYADHHSGTVSTAPGRLNPYKIGIELFRDIEERWNKGKFGPEWESCDNLKDRMRWDRQLGLGREKIFEVRKVHNDVTFIDTFLTRDFCVEHKLFVYNYNPNTGNYEISDRDFKAVKQKLLFSLTNHGQPFIFVIDGNFRNRAELLLQHRYEGVELDLEYAKETLRNIFLVWRRPVNLETVMNGSPKLLTCDGNDFRKSDLEQLTLL
jgi:stage V sporulation protein R